MKCSTLASVTSILSIFRPALALDGYTCVGQNIGHSFLMGEINAHYNEFLQKSPSDPFFTIDAIVFELVRKCEAVSIWQRIF
uniref:Bgt_avrF2_16 n=1 Tax=Blumeria graminis f. sp. tritici 96224 TaxID=1268274 RepID=A0A381KYU6_BLUGR